MERTIYNDGVDVTQTQLNNTESSKAYQIQRRFVDMTGPTQGGRVSGLTVQVVTGQSVFSLLSGTAYTPRGDLLELVNTVPNVVLKDYTLGAVNYLCLIYQETASTPEAHESTGTTLNTTAVGNPVFQVLTQAQYNALPTSSNGNLRLNLQTADLTTLAQDRIYIAAEIIGKGFTTGTPNTYNKAGDSGDDFLAGNIVQAPAVTVVKTAAQANPPTITGVNLKALSSTVALGTGSLTLTVVSTTSWTLTFTAPGDSAGTPVNVSPGETPQTVLVPSHTASMVLTVEVISNLLPTAGGPFTNTVTVYNLYDAIGQGLSAADLLHRSKLGSYLPSSVDPHGMGFTDFGQQIAVIGSPIVAGINFLSTALASLARFNVPGHATARTCFFNVGASGLPRTRGYFNPTNASFEITSNARWDNTTSLWTPDATGYSSQKFTIVPAAFVAPGMDGITTYVRQTSDGSTFADSVWSNGTDGIPQTNNGGWLSLGNLLRGSAVDAAKPRLIVKRAAVYARTALFSDPLTANATTIYLANNITSGGLTDFTPPSLEFCFNCVWNPSTSLWNVGTSGIPAVKIEFNSGGVRVLTFDTTAASTWADSISPWVVAAQLAKNVSTFGGTVEAGASTTALAFATIPRYRGYVNPGQGSGLTSRWLTSEFVCPDGIGYRTYVYRDTSGFYNETTIGCYWDTGGNQWRPDTSTIGSSTLTRADTNGTTQFRKTGSGGSPWSDSGWDNGSQYRVSNTGLTLPTNASGTPPANTLFAQTIPKCVGKVRLASSGGVVTATAYGTNLGTPSTSLVVDTNGNHPLSIRFQTPMADANYAVFPLASYTGLSVDLSSNAHAMHAWPENESTAGFDVYVGQLQTTGSVVNVLNLNNTANFGTGTNRPYIDIKINVFGNQ